MQIYCNISRDWKQSCATKVRFGLRTESTRWSDPANLTAVQQIVPRPKFPLPKRNHLSQLQLLKEMNQFHKQMLRKRAPENPLQALKPIKRRRQPKTDQVTIISSSDSDEDDLEDVDLTGASANPNSSADTSQGPAGSGDSDAFEDLEDVDLDVAFGESTAAPAETLTFTIQAQDEIKEKKSKKATTVPKEERHTRKLIHKLYIEAMIAHGVMRNRWCNDASIPKLLRDLLPKATVKLLNEPWVDGKEIILARRFVLGLLKAQEIYSKSFKVTCQGLVRKDWGDMSVEQNHVEHNVDKAKFRSLISGLQGSRDIGAQGFVALLRHHGVHCRLVFSLQPPDFRSILPAQSTIEKNEIAVKEKSSKPRSEFDTVFIPNAKQEVLAELRSQAASLEPLSKKYKFPMSPYPVFWAEAWNKFSKKWITIDPMVFECVEVMPMRKKGKFEPPGTEKTNQAQYVIAFDKFGRVKDVTRRYTLNYNANVIKKRIDAVSDEDEHWYRMVLRSASTKIRKFRQADIFELKEFYDRDITEGIPKSKKGFKNHPIYALESEIRQDEVIHPKDSSSKCGTFKSANKSTIEPIYKRSHVYRIRTAKAWHMRGRILKVGAIPLKSKITNSPVPDGSVKDSDEEVRLYAEFQTQLYTPPPIVDGKVTKNAYGNVEIYTATMIPENGYLVGLTPNTSMKLLERAARDILRIDYARAIVSFEFGKKGLSTPKEGGILIDKQFKEAINLVIEGLAELEEEQKRKEVEINALRCWKFFLAKLRIVQRLDHQHGKVKPEPAKANNPDDSNDEEGYFSVASEGEGSSGEEMYIPKKTRRHVSEQDQEGVLIEEGGFIPEGDNAESGDHIAGEFISADHEQPFSDNEGGFFFNATEEKDDTKAVPSLGDYGDHLNEKDGKGKFLEFLESKDSDEKIDSDFEVTGYTNANTFTTGYPVKEDRLSFHPEVSKAFSLEKETDKVGSNGNDNHVHAHGRETETEILDDSGNESKALKSETSNQKKEDDDAHDVISIELSEETALSSEPMGAISVSSGGEVSAELSRSRQTSPQFDANLKIAHRENCETIKPTSGRATNATHESPESPAMTELENFNTQQSDEEAFDFVYSDSE